MNATTIEDRALLICIFTFHVDVGSIKSFASTQNERKRKLKQQTDEIYFFFVARFQLIAAVKENEKNLVEEKKRYEICVLRLDRTWRLVLLTTAALSIRFGKIELNEHWNMSVEQSIYVNDVMLGECVCAKNATPFF